MRIPYHKGGEAAVIHSALISFTCGEPNRKNNLLPIAQATTTTLVQAPIYANSAVIQLFLFW